MTLPTALRGRRVRLDVVEARFAEGTPGRIRQRRAVGIGEIRAAGLARLDVPRAGTLRLPCGSAALSATRGWPGSGSGGTRIALGGSVPRAAFDAGRPLRLASCGPARIALPAGATGIAGLPAPLVVDQLRLDGAPPSGLLTLPGDGGTVTRDGTLDGGRLSGAAVRASGPSWLVFGQSYEAGWRARCDGRDLGAPRALQGYANAWPLAAPGCRSLTIDYAPQASVDRALLVSGVSAPFVLALLLWPRRRRTLAATGPAELRAEPELPRRLPLAQALAAGVAIAAVSGFLLALRAGVVIGPVAALVLWRGISSRVLLAASSLLLVVGVPLAYLLTPRDDPGGYDTAYAVQHIGAHWLAVGGLTLLAFVLVRTLSTARARGAGGRRRAP